MKVTNVVVGVVVMCGAATAIWWTAVGRPHVEQARRDSCASNLRQLALGASQYAQDYDERYPPRPRPDGDWMSRIGMGACAHTRGPIDANDGALMPYVNNRCIEWCPSDRAHIYPCGSYLWNNSLCGRSLAECEGKPLGWDHEPWHSRGRNVVDTGGTVLHLRER